MIVFDVFGRHHACSSARRSGSSRVKDFPKLEVLVAAGGRDGRAVRTHARVQDARFVRLRNFGDFGKRRVRPDRQLVVWNAVRRHDFARMRREFERSDLGRRDERIESSGRGRVPEMDRLVARAASGCEQRGLPRTPCQCLRDSASVEVDATVILVHTLTAAV